MLIADKWSTLWFVAPELQSRNLNLPAGMRDLMGFFSDLIRRVTRSLDGIDHGLTGNIRVFALRDALLLTAQGLNGGLSVIYTLTVLGANAVDVGLLGSVNAFVSIFFVLAGGWMGDRYNRKKVFLLGTAITALNPLVYAFAPSWEYLFLANIAAPIGGALANPVGFSIRASSVELRSLVRATATLYTIHAIVNMIVPPIGAVLVTLLGGLESLRMIYLMEAVVTGVAWLYTAKRLQINHASTELTGIVQARPSPRQFLSDLRETYCISRREGTWMFLLLSATGPWAFNIDGNFQTVYANNVCQSSLVTIGFLSSVNAFVSMLLFIPIANLAERKGRMNAVIMIRPIQYLGILLYILSGTFFVTGVTPYIPLLVWGLRTAGGVAGPGWEVASIENMPIGRFSTWNALQSFTSSAFGALAPLVGGLLWEIDPRMPFIWHLAVDSVLRYNIMRRIAKTQKQKSK